MSSASPPKESLARLRDMESELSATDIIFFRRLARSRMPKKAAAKSWLGSVTSYFSKKVVEDEEVRRGN